MIEPYLIELRLAREPGLDVAMRYPLVGGGKRIRPRLCLAAARAGGADPAAALPAAAAVELIHTFSLVHDDLPALDDDDERRGRPSLHIAHGEAVAILAGDGLLNAAFRLATEQLKAPPKVRLRVVSELVAGVAGMIDGQYLDVAGPEPDAEGLVRLHRLKTGSLITAAVGCGLHIAGLDDDAQRPYRAFAAELGLLFQIVDDILDAATDEWGYVRSHGLDGARRLAEETRSTTLELLASLRRHDGRARGDRGRGGGPGGVSIEIAVAGAERIDELEPLWLALHRHHRARRRGSRSSTTTMSRGPGGGRGTSTCSAGGEDVVLIAERAGRPVGYAFLHLHAGPDDTWPVGNRWGEVVSLSVLPEERGAGVGTALLDAVDRELAARGVSDLQVAVMAGNADALRLYERRGLRPAELVLFRFGRAEDGDEATA